MLDFLVCSVIAYFIARYINARLPNWFTAIWSTLLAAIVALGAWILMIGALESFGFAINKNAFLRTFGMSFWVSVFAAIAGVSQGRKEAAKKESNRPKAAAANMPPIPQRTEPALLATSAPQYFADDAVQAQPVVPFAPETLPHAAKKEPDAIQARQMEEAFYEQVASEMAARQVKKGLWAKALAQCDGSHERTKALYIKLRVQSLMDEAVIQAEEKERQRVEKEAAELECLRIEQRKAVELENRRRALEAEQQAKLDEQARQREYEWYKHIGEAASPAAVAESYADYGRTPLIMAVFDNDIKSVKRLIAAGEKIEAADKSGWTALSYAKQLGYTEIVRLLQAAGARR